MEKMSFIFFIIIVAYLLYAFIKTRSENDAVKTPATKEKTLTLKEEKKTDAETAAIAAVIAAVMGDTNYVLKRVYALSTVDERNSSWRYAGRNEMMTKKTLK